MKISRSKSKVKIVQREDVFIRRLLVALGALGFAILLWQLVELWLVLFGAIIVSSILQVLADSITRCAKLPRKWALVAAILMIILIFGFTSWIAGSKVSSESSSLITQLPKAWASFEDRVTSHPLGKYFFENASKIRPDSSSILSRVYYIAMPVANTFTDLVLILVGGLYFAIDPKLYRDGFLKLIPKSKRALIADAFDSTGISLKRWLVAMLAEMAVVGLLTTVGLLLVGFPSAMAMGLVSGIAVFVPYVGLFVAVLPGALIALAKSPQMFFSTIVVYAIVHLVEGYVITPFIEQKVVDVPPALTIFSIVVFGLLFGPLGLIFAAPLTVALMVLVKKLYIEGTLEDRI